MSNEERLEDIKEKTDGMYIFLRESWNGNEDEINFEDDVTWLIQQAEHAQHLERKYENTGSMFGRQAQRTLIDENKKLREALDFIARTSGNSMIHKFSKDGHKQAVHAAEIALDEEDNQ